MLAFDMDPGDPSGAQWLVAFGIVVAMLVLLAIFQQKPRLGDRTFSSQAELMKFLASRTRLEVVARYGRTTDPLGQFQLAGEIDGRAAAIRWDGTASRARTARDASTTRSSRSRSRATRPSSSA